MKEQPKFRIVGKASPETKKQVGEEIKRALFCHFESLSPQEQEAIKNFEYPKSEKERALIKFANKETSRLMQEAGIEPYDVPLENFHIVPTDIYKKVISNSKATAATSYEKQGIIFNAQHFQDNPVYFGAVVLHELLHLKGHQSVEVEEEGAEIHKTPYRTGVGVHALQKHSFNNQYHQHFLGLHEAIVTETVKKLWKKIFDLPELEEEKNG